MGQLAAETKTRVLAAGVDPALVVRFGLAKGASIPDLLDCLHKSGLLVVSVDPDKQAVVAFRGDADLRAFTEGMRAYTHALAQGNRTSTWDVVHFIDPTDVRRWSREDRIGPRLASEGGPVSFIPNEVYKLDVELWHPGTVPAATAALEKVRALVERRQGRVLDSFVGTTLCLARVEADGALVDVLLELGDVAEVDRPPRCIISRPGDASNLARPFPTPAKPAADGPRLCILDSGITSGHPLLSPFVGDASSVHSTIPSAADIAGHGTAVASVAVYGDLRRHIADGSFSSPLTIFSARMLDDAAKLDPDRLVVTQMRDAIERYRVPPHNCRIFNLSFGEERTFLQKSSGRQGIWAEALDQLALKYDVVIVVAAGNQGVETTITAEAEALVVSKGRHLRSPDHRLVDPSTAALAVTVGATTTRVTPTVRPGATQNDITFPVSDSGAPSPFTRVGPGVGGSIKPDFVDEGGNLVWTGFTSHRKIVRDDELSVLVLGNTFAGRTGWFRHDIGTSLAAPRVARVAAMLEHSLRVQLGRPPTGNLIRALLGAGAAQQPSMDAHCGADSTVAFSGYGRVDEDYSLWSSDSRVVLYSEDEVPLDHFALFEVPVPDAFIALKGKKSISVALAYDPPVRAKREEYLGITADFDLFRGIDQQLLFDHYRTRKKVEGPTPKIDRYRVDLSPGGGLRRGDFKWARDRSTLQVGRAEFERPVKNSWWLAVRVRRRWAPVEFTKQRFAIAVVLEAAVSDLYQRVQTQLRARSRARART